jgi:membrane protein
MSSDPKPSLWKLGGLGPIRLGQRVWKEMSDDEILTRSASLAYYLVLALFPAILFVLSIVGFLFTGRADLQTSLLSSASRVMPGSAADLVQRTLHEVTQSSGAGKAAIGILGAWWSASQGVAAVMQSLNVAYEVPERRPWWKQRAIAIGLTLALSVLVLTAIALLLFGGRAAEFTGSRVGLGSVLVVGWKVVQWPVVLAFMFAAFALTYYVAPDLKAPEWHWITPGSLVGLLCWLVASFGLKIYLHFFNSYAKTYGSVGAVIILLLWLYISGFSILLGGEINDEIEKATNTKAEANRAEREQEGKGTMLRFPRPGRVS